MPTSAESFLDESPAPSADSFLDEKPSVNSFLDAAPAKDAGFVAPSDVQIKAYNPTVLDRTRNFIRPLSNIIEKLSTVPEGIPQIPKIPDLDQYPLSAAMVQAHPELGAASGITNSLIGLVNSLPTPVGVALSMGGAPAKIGGALLSPVMAQHAADNFKPTLQTIADPSKTVQEKFQAGTDELGATLGAVLPLAHLNTRLEGKTPEQQSKAIREEVKVTEDKRVADQLTDAADQIDREIEARDAAEAQAKEVQGVIEKQQKAAADAQKAQADATAKAQEIPKSTQILQENKTPPSLANIATEAGTQTSPFALQNKLNEITAAPAPAVDPALAQIASPEAPAPAPSQAQINFERRKALFDAKKKAEKEAVAAAPELPQISREPAGANPAGDISPRQRAARMRQESAGVKGVSFKAPMAEETAAPFEVPKPVELPTAEEVKAADIKKAVNNPETEYQFTVQQGEPDFPGYVQVDAILPSAPEAQSRNTVSSSVKDLNAAGAKLPDVPDWVPTGQYTRAELESLIKKGPPNEQTNRTTGPVDRSADLNNPADAEAAPAARAAEKVGEPRDAIPEQGTVESVLGAEEAKPPVNVGLQEVGEGNAQPESPAGDVALPEAKAEPQIDRSKIEPVANEKIDGLSESKLVALADQLGIKTMGMSGERLRSRIISNALPEDIVQAIDNPAPLVPKKGKIKGSKADQWADKKIKQGGQTLYSGIDPELLAAYVIKTAGRIESGALQFVDWSAEMIKDAGEAIRPYLQQIWDKAHEQVAAKPGERVLAGDNRGTSRSALGKYDYVKTSNADQIAAAQPIIDYVKKTGDYEGGFAKLREIQNSGDRAVAAAAMIPEAENIVDPMARDRVVARLFREAKGVGTDVAQGLQAQGTVNELIEPYRAHLAWMDLVQSRLREEVAPKFPENSAEIINKGVKDAGNQAAKDLAPDSPGAGPLLKGAMDRVRKSADIDWTKIFTDLPERQAERKAEIFKRIYEDPKVAGLSDAAKEKLAVAMEEAWETQKKKVFRKEFEKVIKLPTIAKAEKVALEKAFPELLDRANAGVLDNDAFLEALGRRYGIEGLDSATGQKLRDLGQKAARTPEGSERNEVYQQIMDTIMQARGVNPWDFLKDFWYRNVMSAPRTAVEIGAGGVIQGAARTFTTAVDTAVRQRDPGLALRMVGMFLKDATTGARLGADLVATGDRAILPRYTEQFLAKMANLEKGKSPGGEIESLYRRTSGLGKAALAPFEYTGRVLTALDYVGGQGVRSQQMLYSALTRADKVSFEAAMKRFNGEEVAKAEQQARTELGDKARPAQIIARQREILNQGIDKEIQNFGNTMTEVTALNAPPAGISGEIYKGISKIPMMIRAPAGLAFAKAGLNVFQELTNWAPVTGQVNWARTLWKNPSKNNPFRFLALDELPPERARQLVVSQATGLAVLAAAASKFLGTHPEDDKNKPREWEISGPWTGLTPTQKSALMSAGERPLSIKLPNGRWVDYKLTPFMSALATIGHVRDQERFNGKKYSDEDAANKAVNAWLMGLGSVKDLSLASSFSRLAGFLATDDRQLNVDGVERTLADSVGNSVVGLIPMSSMLRELDNATDGQRYRSDKQNPGVDLWLTQVPFVRRFVNDGKPLLNFLGEPVNVNTNPFNRHVGPGPSTAPVESALSEKVSVGMKLPVLSDNTTIVDKSGKQRPMTGEEIYEYQKSVRQAYARQIAADLPLFQKATPEQASLYSQQVFTAAERYARDRLNTGAQWSGTIPVDPKLTSALSPEYQAVKAADSAEGSKSALNASKMRVQYDQLMALPPEERSAALREFATTQPKEQTRALIQHATSRTTGRTALERATSGLSAPTRAEYYISELAKRPDPEERRAFLQQQLKAGLITKEVLRQIAVQGQKN